ncbi:hypothetical protein IAR55_005323 [Kwoniella newhampshirensis]|uniref:Myb-like domain-containing protein n=1 Tax=Kwoniella newhampshirensis TaxID=1651941 RepID=A0AAW0YW30_9TREE
MPAARTPTTKKSTQSTSTTSPTACPSKFAWSVADKSLLFDHVRMNGEKDWEKAVPGKTGQQSREQWKKTLLPMIRKQCGFVG